MLLRRSMLLLVILLAAALLLACSRSKAPEPQSQAQSPSPGAATAAEPSKATDPTKAAEPGKAADPAKAAEPVKPSFRDTTALPAPRESTPTAFETGLEAMLKAMSEGNWAEAHQYIAARDLTPEKTAAMWKSILSGYYRGDPAKIPNTRVLMVNLDGERADLQVSVPGSTSRLKATYIYRDGRWYISRLGDIFF